jgi:hypothetical protein
LIADCLQHLALHGDRRAERIAHRFDRRREEHHRRKVGVDEQRLERRSRGAVGARAIERGYDPDFVVGAKFGDDSTQMVTVDLHVGIADDENLGLGRAIRHPDELADFAVGAIPFQAHQQRYLREAVA